MNTVRPSVSWGVVRQRGDHLIGLLDFTTQDVDGFRKLLKPGDHIGAQLLVVLSGLGAGFPDFFPHQLDVLFDFFPQLLLILPGLSARLADFFPQLLLVLPGFGSRLADFFPYQLDVLLEFFSQLLLVLPGLGAHPRGFLPAPTGCSA